ncbi:MAG: polysaccharide biosynthesis/export family protein [Bacteroidota bacterium]
MKTFSYAVVVVVSLMLMQSCNYGNNNLLFKTPSKLRSSQPVKVFSGSGYKSDSLYKHKIKIGDRVVINFLQNYDLGQGASQSAASSVINQGEGYLINYDSTAILPLLGRVNMVGMTRPEAARFLEKKYSEAGINNPIIDVNIPTLSVAVYGEVPGPGLIKLDKENTSLVEVLAKCGGFKDAGKKNYVQIIRKDQIILVDLKTIYSVHDPRTVVQDGDIIYVQPYGIKARMEPVTVSTTAILSVLQVIQISMIGFQIYFLFIR